jgi:tRNA pseudouridine55 synthase
MMTPTISGLLVIDKPSGMTSRSAVDRVQGWFPRRTRIGHTGTLDPLATGVLVLCVGTATRLTEFVQAMPKTYRAGLLLGARSETDDLEGPMTSVEVERIPEAAQVHGALEAFIGEVDQVPPTYSAAKVTGRRAYELARKGRTVTLQPRKVTIYDIDILAFAFPRLEIEVRCGKGTYIRSVARDLGENLGCGALIETLRRTRVGPFQVEDAVALDVEADVAHGRMHPLAAAVADLPQVLVDRQQECDLVQGRTILCAGNDKMATFAGAQTCAALDADGRLIAVGTWDASRSRFAPAKVIANQ